MHPFTKEYLTRVTTEHVLCIPLLEDAEVNILRHEFTRLFMKDKCPDNIEVRPI